MGVPPRGQKDDRKPASCEPASRRSATALSLRAWDTYSPLSALKSTPSRDRRSTSALLRRTSSHCLLSCDSSKTAGSVVLFGGLFRIEMRTFDKAQDCLTLLDSQRDAALQISFVKHCLQACFESFQRCLRKTSTKTPSAVCDCAPLPPPPCY